MESTLVYDLTIFGIVVCGSIAAFITVMSWGVIFRKAKYQWPWAMALIMLIPGINLLMLAVYAGEESIKK